MRICLLILFIFCLNARADGQNLLANPGFEDINICTEFNAPCSRAGWFMVLKGFRGQLPVKSGERALPFTFENYYAPYKRAFPYSKILCPLLPGEDYKLQVWLYTGKKAFSHLDVLFTLSDPSRLNVRFGKFEYTLRFSLGDIVERRKDGWILLSKNYIPKEKYRYIVIGNLSNDAEAPRNRKEKNLNSGELDFWIDDISLTATDCTWSPCLEYKQTLTQLYDEKRRHTSFASLDEERNKTSTPLWSEKKSLGPVDPVKQDTLIIPGVVFGVNDSKIDAAGKAVLAEFAERIRNMDVKSLSISGHTDDSGTDTLNQTLSLKRAESVAAYLVSVLPRLKEHVVTIGYGSKLPVALNDTPENRAKNRRVEIVVSYVELGGLRRNE